MLLEIDLDLKNRGVAIEARPGRALGNLARQLGRVIDGDSLLANQVMDWFRTRYGARLLLTRATFDVPVMVAGDVHVISVAVDPKSPLFQTGGLAFKWAIDSGPRFDDSIPASERQALTETVQLSMVCFSEFAVHLCERALPMGATADLAVAVGALMKGGGVGASLCKWSCLQAVEKSLKAFIRARGGKPPNIHDLNKLHQQAQELELGESFGTLQFVEGDALELVQCSPAVRYDAGVTPAEAVHAFHAAMVLCARVALRLRLEAGGKSWLTMKGEERSMFIVGRMCGDLGIQFKGPANGS